MAKYGKLGRETGVRLALLGSRATALIANDKIATTETRAKEVRKIVKPSIALIVKEKDNFRTVSVTVKVPRKDVNGKHIEEEKDGKRAAVYDTVQEEIKKDKPSRMNARCHMLARFYAVGEFDPKHKKAGKKVSLIMKLFDEYGPKYEGRKDGYTHIVKIGLKKGDAVMEVLLELV